MALTASPATPSPALIPETLTVVAWEDPVVARIGVDVFSEYVDVFWLSVLGPTATWILRHLNRGLAVQPDGYVQDTARLAAILGLNGSRAEASPFGRALHRCEMFGVTRTVPGALAVRRVLPPLAARQVARLPQSLQDSHRAWRQLQVAGTNRA